MLQQNCESCGFLSGEDEAGGAYSTTIFAHVLARLISFKEKARSRYTLFETVEIGALTCCLWLSMS